MTETSLVFDTGEDIHELKFKDVIDAVARVDKALGIIWKYGAIDGGHHKAWVIDQVLRALLADQYDEFIEVYRRGEDGPDTYKWDTGIVP